MKTAEEMIAFCKNQHLTIGLPFHFKGRTIGHFKVIAQALEPDEDVVFAFPGWCAYTSWFRNEGIYAYAITNKRILAGQARNKLKFMALDRVAQILYFFKSGYIVQLTSDVIPISITFFSKDQADFVMSQFRDVCEKARIVENLSPPWKSEQPKIREGAFSLERPEFPLKNKDGLDLMKVVSFTLSGVNHTHNGSNPQAVIRKNNLKGQWLTLTPIVNNPYDDTPVQVEYQGQYIGWLPATNVTLKERDAKIMIFRRLMREQEVLARCDDITTIQIGGWDLEEDDPEIEDHLWQSPRITCAIYEAPKKRRST